MSRTKHHGDKAKQRLFGNDWNWTSSKPSWWVRLMMGKPQRMRGRVWQRSIERSAIQSLDDAKEAPSIGRKPQIYYW